MDTAHPNSTREILDVAPLPDAALDHRSPIWWGNVLLLVIETTMFALLAASYFYVRQNYETWPPPQVNGPFALLRPVPTLSLPLVNLLILTVSLVPLIVADRAALRMNAGRVKAALVVSLAFSAVLIAIRFREFRYLNCRWDDHAYASIIWTTTGMHLLHLIVGSIENLFMTMWIFAHGMDEKHSRDVRVAAIYWYWIVGIWWILFAMIFWSPRLWPQGHL
jgi:cytochrome c oxidase subunit III